METPPPPYAPALAPAHSAQSGPHAHAILNTNTNAGMYVHGPVHPHHHHHHAHTPLIHHSHGHHFSPVPSTPPFFHPVNPHIHHSHPHVYGPTPLPQTVGSVLPYYDPRSPYSLEQAGRRARWRFFGALIWALGIWTAIGLVTGSIIVERRHW